MAKLNEDGQWIVMMGFIVSILIFILAIIVAESALVGKTTSESVLEFPKTDIQDLRAMLFHLRWEDLSVSDYEDDIKYLYLERKNAVVNWTIPGTHMLSFHYNNGITSFNEEYEEVY